MRGKAKGNSRHDYYCRRLLIDATGVPRWMRMGGGCSSGEASSSFLHLGKRGSTEVERGPSRDILGIFKRKLALWSMGGGGVHCCAYMYILLLYSIIYICIYTHTCVCVSYHRFSSASSTWTLRAANFAGVSRHRRSGYTDGSDETTNEGAADVMVEGFTCHAIAESHTSPYNRVRRSSPR